MGLGVVSSPGVVMTAFTQSIGVEPTPYHFGPSAVATFRLLYVTTFNDSFTFVHLTHQPSPSTAL